VRDAAFQAGQNGTVKTVLVSLSSPAEVLSRIYLGHLISFTLTRVGVPTSLSGAI
jgi:hypothetical protein